jgi:N-acyl-D-amino-acid deacylase
MLCHPLQFDPGTRYAYSNFGYCLLGRVIEKAGGLPYEDYVRKEILTPLGIDHMHVGKTLLSQRAKDEVKYYVLGGEKTGPAVLGPEIGKQVPLPYGSWCQETLDAHGGWTGTAPELVRFATAFANPRSCRVLSPASITQMFTCPSGRVGQGDDGKSKDHVYGCGWSLVQLPHGQFNFWHNGLLPGTSTELVHRSDGLTWAILFNGTPDSKRKSPADLIDPLMHKALDSVTKWP